MAREAGVSVPTVYRHFGTKAELLAELYPHVARRSGFDGLPDPSSLADVREAVRELFARLDAMDDLARAAYREPARRSGQARDDAAAIRAHPRLGDSIEPTLTKADQDRITRLMVILTSSSALRIWRDHLGSSVEEAADDVDWIVRAAIDAATQRNEAMSARARFDGCATSAWPMPPRSAARRPASASCSRRAFGSRTASC